MVKVLEGTFVISRLSLALLRVLPLGGLTPRFGRVIILSIFGSMYGPNTFGSTLRYSLSPSCFIHSSIFSWPSLTWYQRFGCIDFCLLQLVSIDLIDGNNSWGGYIMAMPLGLQILADCLIIMSAVSLSSSSIHKIGDDWDILVDIIVGGCSFSSLTRNSDAASFLMSLYFDWLMSSVMGVADMCS